MDEPVASAGSSGGVGESLADLSEGFGLVLDGRAFAQGGRQAVGLQGGKRQSALEQGKESLPQGLAGRLTLCLF